MFGYVAHRKLFRNGLKLQRSQINAESFAVAPQHDES